MTCVDARLKQASQKSAPPTKKDMLKIALGLTITCLVSAVILGAVYLVTEPIKTKNLLTKEAETIKGMLELPSDSDVIEVRRYMTAQLEPIYLTDKSLLKFDENNILVSEQNVPDHLNEKNKDLSEEKDLFVFEKIQGKYIGRFFVGKNKENILGYVVEGDVLGYKAKIRFFAAIAADFTLRGVEILEQEEDPGLGGEISQKYFKNQFAGKSSKTMENLLVTKTPLPDEWRKSLEELGAIPFSSWSDKNKSLIDKNTVIYAITGATISSEAVTGGIKKTLSNFQKRWSLIKEKI